MRLTTLTMCHCKHSGCLKKFCECWAAKKECTFDCKCDNCGNIAGTDDYNKAMLNYKETVIKCMCINSKCIKKYCICFLNGKKCGKKCRCIECKNVDNSLNNELSIIQDTVIEDAPVTPKRKSTKRNISTPLRSTKTKRPKVDSKPIITKMEDISSINEFKYSKESWEYEEWDLSLVMWWRVK